MGSAYALFVSAGLLEVLHCNSNRKAVVMHGPSALLGRTLTSHTAAPLWKAAGEGSEQIRAAICASPILSGRSRDPALSRQKESQALLPVVLLYGPA